MIANPHCQRDSEWIDSKNKRHYVEWKRGLRYVYTSVRVELNYLYSGHPFICICFLIHYYYKGFILVLLRT